MADPLVWPLDARWQDLDGATDVVGTWECSWTSISTAGKMWPNYFYADSGFSAGKFTNRIERADFSRWSVSYGKWTDETGPLGG